MVGETSLCWEKESHGNGTALSQPYKFLHCEAAATTVGNSRSSQWFKTIILILRKKNKTQKAPKTKQNQTTVHICQLGLVARFPELSLISLRHWLDQKC